MGRCWKPYTLAIFCALYHPSLTSDNNKKKILITNWVGQPKKYQLKATYLRKEPIFNSFNKQFFQEHLIPNNSILFRHSDASVTGSVLSSLCEQAVRQLRDGDKKLSHFTILKDLEFDRKQFAGAMVLKFNDYPFVFKLFIENPQSFLQPRCKGFRHGCMAVISGGINRYLSGFKRIENLEITKKLVAENNILSRQFDFPRKWYWQPENNRWFQLHGKHFEDHELVISLPEVYGIIADEIVSDARLAHIRKHYGRDIFAACKSVNFRIDPNMKNFRLENKTQKLVLIDTEHFPSLLGTTHLDPDNYFFLHLQIGYKAVRDKLIR